MCILSPPIEVSYFLPNETRWEARMRHIEEHPEMYGVIRMEEDDGQETER